MPKSTRDRYKNTLQASRNALREAFQYLLTVQMDFEARVDTFDELTPTGVKPALSPNEQDITAKYEAMTRAIQLMGVIDDLLKTLRESV